MKCNKKHILALTNNELSKKEQDDIKVHLETCHSCRSYYDELNTVDKILTVYHHQAIDDDLQNSLLNIQFNQKKKIAFLNLFPKEFALTTASIMLALIIGGVFSNVLINNKNNTLVQQQDYLEQISLVSLIEY